jgi:hypothetical protein
MLFITRKAGALINFVRRMSPIFRNILSHVNDTLKAPADHELPRILDSLRILSEDITKMEPAAQNKLVKRANKSRIKNVEIANAQAAVGTIKSKHDKTESSTFNHLYKLASTGNIEAARNDAGFSALTKAQQAAVLAAKLKAPKVKKKKNPKNATS